MARSTVQSRLEALETLGLAPGVGRRMIVRTYRRLAVKHHPDRAISRGVSPGEVELSRRRFARIAAAFALLEQCGHEGPAECGIAACSKCGDVELLRNGLDGNAYCHDCLTRSISKRALPAPPVDVVCGGFALACLAAAICAMALYLESRQFVYWWASVLACVAGIVHLARLCVTIGYGVDPVVRSRGGWRRRVSRSVRRLAVAGPRRRSRLGRS